MTETTVGREPVQIVELQQPICGNTYGVSPCTASGGADAKCYNTRATCRDTANYRSTVEALLTPDLIAAQGDNIPGATFTGTADFFAAFDLYLPAAADGLIWEMGSAARGAYLGIDGGNLVARAGHGSTAVNSAVISSSASALLNRTLTVFVGIDVSASSITVWYWDEKTRTVTEFGTATASSGFPSSSWVAIADGAVGRLSDGGTYPGTATSADYNGEIYEARFYDSLGAPDMTVDFRLLLHFSSGKVAEQRISGAPYIIPSLISVSTSPAKINLAGSNPDAQGLGNRAICSLSFSDHAHTDLKVDPYVSGRSWNPLDAGRGSFWSRWLRRNRYRQNMIVRVYEGYSGQALSAMTVRSYFLQSASGVSPDGRVTLQGKDVLARIEERKAQAPSASPGVLYADITDSATSFEIAGVVITEYTSSGTVRIGDEVMTYTGSSTTANGITLTGVTRGTDGTTAAEHSANDAVQQCLRYVNMAPDLILKDLLYTYGGIEYSYLDLVGWDAEVSTYLSFYNLSSLITEPTSVADLVSQLQVQALVYLWWDERVSKVKLKAIRGIDSEPDTLTEENNIIEGSFSISEKPRERASQVWLYYGRNKFERSIEDANGYSSQYVAANLTSETDDLYGEASIRTIYGNWIGTDVLAANTANKIITRYVDTPSECTFMLDAKDRGYWLGDVVRISHHIDVDEYGERNVRNWTIVSAEEVKHGETVRYTAEDTTLYSKIYYVMATGAADYPGYDSAPFKNCYIGDANGLLSDGEEAGKIS